MRILVVSHGFPPKAGGGAEIHAHDLAVCLSADPADSVHVLAREADPARAELSIRRERRGALDIYWLNNNYRDVRCFADTYRNPRVTRVLADVVDEARPDLAHVHHLTNLSTDLITELARRRVPVVFTLHDFWLLCQRGQLLDLDYQRCPGPAPGPCSRCLGLSAGGGERLYRARDLWQAVAPRLPDAAARTLTRAAAGLARRASQPDAAARQLEERLAHVRTILGQVTRFVAPSDTVRSRFIDFGVPADRIRRLPYGHDHRPFAHLERTPAAELRLGFIGSLMVSKAPHLLLEAVATLPPGAATVRLLGTYVPYHGDERYQAVLAPLLATPGVSAPQAIPHEAVPQALAGLDVVVVPSIWLENAPLVISEAFLAGVPVVASRLGGMAEMVQHEVNGLLFTPGDAADLRRQLARLLDEPGLLARLRRGIPRIESITEVAAELRREYAGLVSGPPRGRRRLAAVIVNYRTAERTVACARALRAEERPVDDVVVVDNGSGDGSAERLRRELPAVRHLALETNRGFSGGTNAGIGAALAAGADLVLLVNSDATLAPDCLRRLEDALLGDPRLGIVGPTVVVADGSERIESMGISYSPVTGRMRLRESGRRLGDTDDETTRVVDAVAGCVMALRREVIETVGPLDDDYFFSFEEIDFCLRARRAGWSTACVRGARALHEGSASIGRASPARLYYAARNHLLLARRVEPHDRWPRRLTRATCILGLNLAHAVARSDASRLPALRATARGVLDHLRGRYGPDPAA